MTRNPIVAGKFYEGTREALINQINQCFLSEFGPGVIPERNGKKIKAIISPHAGYPFSGPCSAWAYKEIMESEEPDVYVILGFSHQGSGSGISAENWRTPLGDISNDKILAKLVSEKTGIEIDEVTHLYEHSIEVQIPFLQFTSTSNSAKILPINIGNDLDLKEFGKNLFLSLKESGKSYILICSSDFTHLGMNFGYFPFDTNVKENMHKLDNMAIQFILNHDPAGFNDYLNKTGATICGRNPITAMLYGMDFEKANLLKYYTSGDMTNDYTSAVGYASIVFE